MTTIHIMLDLETWGTAPGCDLRSIGACVFSPDTGHVGQDLNSFDSYNKHTFYIATNNPAVGGVMQKEKQTQHFYKYPLTRNPQTVQWWNEQSDAAKAAFANPVDLAEALRLFGKWLRSVSPPGDYYDIGEHDRRFPDDIRLWSHGAAFDPPILAAAYEAVGLPVPWHYRAPRDTRTIFEVAGMDPHRCLDMFTTGTHHHALDDAICQAKAVCAAYKALRP